MGLNFGKDHLPNIFAQSETGCQFFKSYLVNELNWLFRLDGTKSLPWKNGWKSQYVYVRIHPIKIGCLPRVISPRKRPPQPTTRLQLELVLFSGSRYKLHKFSTQNSTPKTPPMPTEKLNISKKRLELQTTSFLKSCFNGMIPNHCLKNNCCTRHPLKRLLFRVPGCFKCCSFSAAKKVLYVVFFFRHHCRCFCS